MGFEGDVELSIVSVEVVLNWHGRNDRAEGGSVEYEQERSEDGPLWHTMWCREMWRHVSKSGYNEGARREVGREPGESCSIYTEPDI